MTWHRTLTTLALAWMMLLTILAPVAAQSPRGLVDDVRHCRDDVTRIVGDGLEEGPAWIADQIREAKCTAGALVNEPPGRPSSPDGPSWGGTGYGLTYCSSATDPDGDRVQLTFKWGDGTESATSFVASGETACATHAWTHDATDHRFFQIAVCVRDKYGEPHDEDCFEHRIRYCWDDDAPCRWIRIWQSDDDCRTGADAPGGFEGVRIDEDRSGCTGWIDTGGPDGEDVYSVRLDRGDAISGQLRIEDGCTSMQLFLHGPGGTLDDTRVASCDETVLVYDLDVPEDGVYDVEIFDNKADPNAYLLWIHFDGG